MTTLHSRKSIDRSPWRCGFVLIALTLTWFAFSPTARAQDDPETDLNGNSAMEGSGALSSLTTGSNNTALGYEALYNNTTGSENTATGYQALFSNTTGEDNTANGIDALYSNTTGNNNTAHGDVALFSNTTGNNNTATGNAAMYNNTTGSGNAATGSGALVDNTTGNANTANGESALAHNTTGGGNTATGLDALFSNTIGNDNTANGYLSLFNNNGAGNTANGFNALFNNTTGALNTANGDNALDSNTTGSSNIALGHNAGVNLTTGDNNIDIGNNGVATEANTIRIGGSQTNAFMAGIYNTTVAKGVSVVIDSTGHLGTKGSAERFKDAIKPMDKASEGILALKPVTFHYKKELDPEGVPQFGLVAEEVAKVNPALVARDDKGKIYTVRYDAVNAMLLNEFLKQHRQVQEQQKQIEKLTAGLQKVSDQLELSKPAPRTVLNNQ